MNAVDWHIRIPTPSMARLIGGSAKTLFMKPRFPMLGADFACMHCRLILQKDQ